MEKSLESTPFPDNQLQNDNTELAKAILGDMDACGTLDDLLGETDGDTSLEIHFSDGIVGCNAKK